MPPNKQQRGLKYRDWIRMGEKFLDSYSEPDWDRWGMYMYTPHVATSIDESVMSDDGHGYKLPYNIIWQNVKTLTHILTGGDPKPVVKPRRDNMDKSARLLSRLMEFFIKETDFYLEYRMCIQDCLLYNLAYFKQGYFVQLNDAINYTGGPRETLRKALENENLTEEEINKKVLDSIKDYDDSAEIMLAEAPGTESWYGERVDPKHILVPPTARYSLDKAPWLIHKIYKTSYDAIRSFPDIDRYKPTTKKNFGSEGEPIEVDAFEIYEIWDKTNPNKKKIIYMVASEALDDNASADESLVDYYKLKEMEWPEGLEGFPITRLSFNLSASRYYLPPDLFMYEHLAQALSELISTRLSASRKERRRYGYDPNSVSPEEMNKIAYGPDGIFFASSNGNTNAVWELESSQQQLDFGFFNLLQRMVGEFSGVDEFVRGSSSRVESATEASYVRSGSQAKLDDMVLLCERFMKEVFTKQGLLIQSHMSGPLMIKIDPDDMLPLGAESPWISVKNEDIEGEYNYDIEAGTLTRETSEDAKRKFRELYNLAANDPYFEGVGLRRKLLEKWLEIRDPDEFLKVGLAGQTDQAIKLEHQIAMMGQQIPDPNPQEDHAAHAEAHETMLRNPPEQFKQRIAQVQNQLATGQEVQPGQNQQQAQAVQAELQKFQQIVATHLEIHRNYLNPKPVDHNTAQSSYAEGEQRPDSERPTGTTVELGIGE